MSDKNLYVIRLDDDILKVDKFLKQNPKYRRGRPCMYVGVTSHDPKKRFKQHKNGYKSSRIAKKYGKYLMWKKFRDLNPVPSNEAEKRGRRLRRISGARATAFGSTERSRRTAMSETGVTQYA